MQLPGSDGQAKACPEDPAGGSSLRFAAGYYLQQLCTSPAVKPMFLAIPGQTHWVVQTYFDDLGVC